MKLVIIALVFNFLLSCWPKLDIKSVTQYQIFIMVIFPEWDHIMFPHGYHHWPIIFAFSIFLQLIQESLPAKALHVLQLMIFICTFGSWWVFHFLYGFPFFDFALHVGQNHLPSVRKNSVL